MYPAIVWFRRDLRLADNPALQAALHGGAALAVYIHAPQEEGEWTPGGASNWWLHHSLLALDAELRARGARLIVRSGPALECLLRLIDETGARRVHWNRLYEPAESRRDARIEQALRARGAAVYGHNAALLFEPWSVATGDGRPYRVFTPFWKACQRSGLPGDTAPAPAALPAPPAALASLPVDALELLPAVSWDTGFRGLWQPGETGARHAMEIFLDGAADDYAQGRDRPDRVSTSRLSPHLHFGEIGPRQALAAVLERLAGDTRPGLTPNLEGFLRQLGWREFAHHLLHHFPHTPDSCLDERFARFPWAEDRSAALHAWQSGRTGIPLVDAGMRELWHTGWMHNRVRMVTASFLVKNLLVPWQEGARWFWDTLLDADLANNTLGWQWVAGCGADAAPYFRVFNPVLQSRKFDPEGRYLRRWIPELAGLPDRNLHAPWEAPEATLKRAGVRLGSDYPAPVVDLAASRRRALDAYAAIKRA